MDIESVWRNIRIHEGEEFHTVSGLPFTYAVVGNILVPSRTNYSLGKSEVEKVMSMMPVKGPGSISRLVRGSSYLFALLTDSRIAGTAER